MRTSLNSLLCKVFILFLIFCQPVYSQSSLQILQSKLPSGADDVEEEASGKVNMTSSVLELVYNNSTTGNQVIGLRFTNVSIPNNAVISKAYIQFTSRDVQTGSCNLIIEGHAADNAPAFTTLSKNVSSRTRTSSKISWTPPGWNTIMNSNPLNPRPI